jgi:DNA-binding response OmpR family regulator
MTPPTILVVDDDRELRKGLQAVLQRQGYLTLEAGDGIEARNLIEKQTPDLVIMDMMMPQLGGLPVLEYFQDRENAPPFLMITATEGGLHQSYAERIGARDYIKKPFKVKRLLEGVEKCLGKTPAEETEPQESTGRSTLRCKCGACGANIRAPHKLIGQTRTCPGCNQPFIVRPQPPEDEGPRLLLHETAKRPGRY